MMDQGPRSVFKSGEGAKNRVCTNFVHEIRASVCFIINSNMHAK